MTPFQPSSTQIIQRHHPPPLSSEGGWRTNMESDLNAWRGRMFLETSLTVDPAQIKVRWEGYRAGSIATDGCDHSPQEIPRNECCCCEQPIGKQQNGGKFVLLLCDWLFTTTTFVPWDFLWAMIIKLTKPLFFHVFFHLEVTKCLILFHKPLNYKNGKIIHPTGIVWG